MATFARTSSGLRREFRVLDIFVFNVLAYAIGVSLVITPPLLGGYPTASPRVVFGLGLILSISNGLVYGLMAAAMPRSGGDYVFITRTLHPWLGFTASFGFCFSQIFGIGLYASQCISSALGSSLSVLGYVDGVEYLTVLGEALTDPIWNIVGGMMLLATVYFISIRGLRALKYFLQILFIVALLGILAMGYVFWSVDHTEFVTRFDAFMLQTRSLPGAYDQILAMAAHEGLIVGGEWSLWSSILALPVGYLAFVGFTYSVYLGGEVRAPERNQRRGIIGALLFGCGVFFIILDRYYEVAGKDFINALSMLSALEKNPVPLDGSLVLLANILTDSVTARGLICLGFFLWYYLLLFVMTQACVRILFAWSMDRLAPEALTRITDRTAAPYVAVRVVLCAAAFGLLISATTKAPFLNYVALFSICFLVAGIAAIFYPLRRRAEFDRAPVMVRRRFLGIPVLQLAGIGNTVLFVVVLISALYRPDIGGGAIGWKPTTFIFGVYLVGFIWYEVVVHRTHRIDPAIIFEELPPDTDDDLGDDANPPNRRSTT